MRNKNVHTTLNQKLKHQIRTEDWSYRSFRGKEGEDRVDCNIRLDYKANIKHNTGESWENVELTLETTSPSYNFEIPELLPWNLSQYTE
ncbi:hypothetical protein MPER_05544 [Moniliophthora perniciosa FA553]|nr:hypothetical protein MPER_05544 [Moniliophthora perniciosa FA553]